MSKKQLTLNVSFPAGDAEIYKSIIERANSYGKGTSHGIREMLFEAMRLAQPEPQRYIAEKAAKDAAERVVSGGSWEPWSDADDAR